MNKLIEVIAKEWGWKLGKPVAIVATNHFGNAIVQNTDGHFFRIIPEELDCQVLAGSIAELAAERSKPEFVRDWEMTALVAQAEAALGVIREGEVYCLAVPAVLGGKYSVENFRKIPFAELLGASGSLASQLDGAVPGEDVTIVVE